MIIIIQYMEEFLRVQNKAQLDSKSSLYEAAENSSSKCWKYVDDLTFADDSTCAHYPSSPLPADLYDFAKWSKDNMLKLNPSKCQALQVYFG